MRRPFTLEHWRDGEWYVGRLVEVPGVFSQGGSLDELRENIRDAYDLMEREAVPTANRLVWSALRTVLTRPPPAPVADADTAEPERERTP